MTLAEWIEAVITMRGLWPNAEIPDNTVKEWFAEVEDLRADQVVSAIRTFSRDGDEWPPTGGKIRKRVAELVLDIPDWHEVLEQLREIRRTPATKATGELVVEDDDTEYAPVTHPREDVIARTHPMIVAFFLHLGSQVILGADPNDGNAEARLRDKWAAFQGTATRRLSYLGLDAADLPALERAARRTKQLRDAGTVFAGIQSQIARQLPAGEQPESTTEGSSTDG